MAKGKTIALYVGMGLGSFCVVAGWAIRDWLRAKAEEAGSPSAFATQMALSSLERRMAGKEGEALSSDQRKRIQQAVLRLRKASPHFVQAKTMALFTAIRDYDERTKREQGHPSLESVQSLVVCLEGLVPPGEPQ